MENKCRYFDSYKAVYQNHYLCKRMKVPCPCNVDKSCNIIPKKAKDVKVKMFIRKHACRAAGFVVRVDDFIGHGRRSYPCTLVITAANWKKIKGVL